MYTKTSTIITNRQNLSNYISGYDVYNSTLLVKLNDPSLKKEEYQITTYEFRPDLIAKDYYGSYDYTGLVVLMAARGLETYTKGSIIKLIIKEDLENLLRNI